MLYVSVDELFDFLFDGEVREKGVAVLWRASIDDSADKNREKVIISACLIGDCEQWRALVRPWKTKLAEHGLDYFKSSDHITLTGQFKRFRNELNYPKPKGREQADKIREELDQIIRKSEVVGIGTIVPVAAFEKVRAEPKYAALISPDPYDWAIQILWDQCARAMGELGKNNVVTFAHDDGDNFVHLFKLFKDYKSRNPKSAKRIADFAPLDDRQHPTIQAADVAASVTQRLALEYVENPNTATLRRLQSNFYKAAVATEEWTREALDSVIRIREKTHRVA